MFYFQQKMCRAGLWAIFAQTRPVTLVAILLTKRLFVNNAFCLNPFALDQGCQMVGFQTKIQNLGKFWRALEWKMLVCIMVIWNILKAFDIYYGHLVML
jgi:hypothetical protein